MVRCPSAFEALDVVDMVPYIGADFVVLRAYPLQPPALERPATLSPTARELAGREENFIRIAHCFSPLQMRRQ